jgi:hypothetical protein
MTAEFRGSYALSNTSNAQSTETVAVSPLPSVQSATEEPVTGEQYDGVHGAHNSWRRMIDRCTSPMNPSFQHYGGRGIGIAAEWRGESGFALFLAHTGPRPSQGHTLDRIDNDAGYEPGNVRWASARQQGRNKRNNLRLTVGDETLTVSEWAERTGLNARTIRNRLRLGWPVETAVGAPKVRPGWSMRVTRGVDSANMRRGSK